MTKRASERKSRIKDSPFDKALTNTANSLILWTLFKPTLLLTNIVATFRLCDRQNDAINNNDTNKTEEYFFEK